MQTRWQVLLPLKEDVGDGVLGTDVDDAGEVPSSLLTSAIVSLDPEASFSI